MTFLVGPVPPPLTPAFAGAGPNPLPVKDGERGKSRQCAGTHQPHALLFDVIPAPGGRLDEGESPGATKTVPVASLSPRINPACGREFLGKDRARA